MNQLDKEINIILEKKEVNSDIRILPTKWTLEQGIPIFGIYRGAWKQFGIKNIFQYWLWKRKMRKQWKIQ